MKGLYFVTSNPLISIETVIAPQVHEPLIVFDVYLLSLSSAPQVV